MIKLLLVDDHQILLDGLKAIIDKDKNLEIVGQALLGSQAIEIIKDREVDIVILDIDMPESELDGIDIAKIIKNDYPNIDVIILSMHEKRGYILPLMEIGVDGYILKNRSKEELLEAINQVYKGQSFFGQKILNAISKPGPNIGTKLTSREVEILILIAEGLRAKEIAEKLFIEETTVNAHKRNMRHKLDLHRDTALVRYAFENGYIRL